MFIITSQGSAEYYHQYYIRYSSWIMCFYVCYLWGYFYWCFMDLVLYLRRQWWLGEICIEERYLRRGFSSQIWEKLKIHPLIWKKSTTSNNSATCLKVPSSSQFILLWSWLWPSWLELFSLSLLMTSQFLFWLCSSCNLIPTSFQFVFTGSNIKLLWHQLKDVL